MKASNKLKRDLAQMLDPLSKIWKLERVWAKEEKGPRRMKYYTREPCDVKSVWMEYDRAGGLPRRRFALIKGDKK